MSQKELADRSGITQSRISDLEKGKVLPTLPQLIWLARALTLPLQNFLSGTFTPRRNLDDLAIQLQSLGLLDLFVPNARVPGAFRPTEQVLAIIIRGSKPDPRIVEGIPALLAWNTWSPSRLREYSRPRSSKACTRLAWLADIALTIEKSLGFPGGCPQKSQLEEFVEPLANANRSFVVDDLGRPGDMESLPPASRRWHITYAASITNFFDRAKSLNDLRQKNTRDNTDSGVTHDE